MVMRADSRTIALTCAIIEIISGYFYVERIELINGGRIATVMDASGYDFRLPLHISG